MLASSHTPTFRYVRPGETVPIADYRVEMDAVYPVGLRLAGRRVVVVGGGHVAQRRIPALLAAGGSVVVVSPTATPSLEGWARAGEVVWLRRGYAPGDLDGAWYALVATDDPDVNAAVSAEAEQQRVWCVRSDDAFAATAWTPASGHEGPVTVAVWGTGDHQRSPAIRDAVLARLRSGEIVAPLDRPRVAEVVLVGAGPGDPELITLAGRRALQSADVVVADRLAPRELLADLGSGVELVDAGKLPRGAAASQQTINQILVERARQGLNVVRLKGGDPFVFGRGFEEVEACTQAGVPVRIVPGVTSAISVPAIAGVPVTHRGMTHEFTVVSGHVPPGHPGSLVDWAAVASLRGTLVLLMAVDNLRPIASVLITHGRHPGTPVAVVQEGYLPGEKVVRARLDRLADTAEAVGLRPPAVVVIGDVAGLGLRGQDARGDTGQSGGKSAARPAASW
jgi:uroporphyrin-III C-methyltransferase/precorrin-2 dehydrogenase/sirohydrochlorin ferrochelatase